MVTIGAMNGEKDSILILPVKPVVQANNYECGVACVQTILGTKGIRSNRLGLKKVLGTSRVYGTLPRKIKAYLSTFDFVVKEKHRASLSSIEAELKKGRMCLVAYQAWGAKKYFESLQSGHYSVVFGIEDGFLWLADPNVKGSRVRYKRGIRKIKKEVFEARWKDEDGKKKLYDHWYLAL
jgi:predicted double-glycine peptidase